MFLVGVFLFNRQRQRKVIRHQYSDKIKVLYIE